MSVPRDARREEPEAPAEAVGGGGTMVAASGVPVAPRFPEETVGGGATTSCVPKSLPTMLLTNDPLAA